MLLSAWAGFQLADCCSKGELEHRSPKSRYTRTNRKHFVRQLTQIERRQTRIRHLRYQLGTSKNESIPRAPHAHHIIGETQNDPESIPTFLQKHAGDPAVKVRIYICERQMLTQS